MAVITTMHPGRRGAEMSRLAGAPERRARWKMWGPYLSERQWGTVREDYSENGDAWNYLPHDHARSRAYRWGEDGLAGICDDQQHLCFAIALWNGADPILKERLFGLTNTEGNHGEDVKEYYFYLDSTPTHSYMKWLYKYPQSAYPYLDLVNTNRARSRTDPEYELLDTGAFADDRYFDVFVEYAKAAPDDILVRITVFNRAAQAATIDVLPTIWFRNTWSSWPHAAKPWLRGFHGSYHCIEASHPALGERWLYVDGHARLLFTENETNRERLFGRPNPTLHVKDGINDFVVNGNRAAIQPNESGTKAAARFHATIAGGDSVTFRLRLTDAPPDAIAHPFDGFDQTFTARVREADQFYESITPASAGEDVARVLRQAFAGMLWSKQFYAFDLRRWIEEHGVSTSDGPVFNVRDGEWSHMVNADVISMPDKWEYPWFAGWDLAFHAIALSGVDIDFAKSQLELMLRAVYMHPNGQIPAYEWNFSDVNPPVHAWATIFMHRADQVLRGRSDIDFLKRSFGKLLSNFAWWVNRRDARGRSIFEGGFLGLDTIGIFDRTAPMVSGGRLEQADSTAWMALFCQNMLEIAAEIAGTDPAFEDLATTFVDHFLTSAAAINRVGHTGMWDEEDGFYYDVLRFPDGTARRLKVRSVVGLLPVCATTVFDPDRRDRMPRLLAHARERLRREPQLADAIHPTGAHHLGYRDRGILAVVTPDRLRRVLAKVLDEREFLGRFGIRSLSRVHKDHPYVIHAGGQQHTIAYTAAESGTPMFGGNTHWCGPIWMPLNVLLIRALLQFYSYYGDTFVVECPTGSGVRMHLFDVAREIAMRLTRIFLRDEHGRRPVFGGTRQFQEDPLWRDYVLFHEYFNGDDGSGLGASHQTGWTGLIAPLIQLFWTLDAREMLDGGAHEAHDRLYRARQLAMKREPTTA